MPKNEGMNRYRGVKSVLSFSNERRVPSRTSRSDYHTEADVFVFLKAEEPNTEFSVYATR